VLVRQLILLKDYF